MKAVILKKHTNNYEKAFKFEEIPDPVPRENEVVIKIQAVGINYADTLSRRGLYQWAPKPPYIPGLEGAGTVESVGENVTKFQPGDKVVFAVKYGAYAEKIAVPENFVYPIIPHYSIDENAAFLVNFATAYIAIFEFARMRENESILIQAAAGGVGTAAVQLARALNLKVFGTASRPEKIELLEKLGINLAINYRKEDFVEKVMTATNGMGVDMVLESVGGQVFYNSVKCLAPLGKIVVIGLASIRLNKYNPLSLYSAYKTIPKLSLLKMLGKSYGVMAFHAGRILYSQKDMTPMWERLKKLLLEHKEIKPVIGKIFPLEQAPLAHKFIEERKSYGKVLLKP